MAIKNVSFIKGSPADPYADAERQRALADYLQQQALTSPITASKVPLSNRNAIGLGITQLGQALLANRAGRKADQADQVVQARTDQATADYNKMSGIPEMQLPALGNREPIQLEGSGRDAIANALTNKYSSPGLLSRAQMDYQGMEGDKARQENAQARQEQLQLAGDLKREQIAQQGQTAKQIAQIAATSREGVAGTAADARLEAARIAAEAKANAADQKKAASAQADQGVLQTSIAGMDRLAATANQLLNHPGLNGITGLRGAVFNMPGSAAANAEELLNTLKSQVGFGVLQDMRNNSKTGGALGNVSNLEEKLLQDNLAPLGKAQSFESMKKSLQAIIDYTNAAKGRFNSAYQTKYADVAPPGTPPGGAAPTAPAAPVKRVKVDAQGNVVGN